MKQISYIAIIISLFCFSVGAQVSEPPRPVLVSGEKGPVKTFKFDSRLMGRTMLFQAIFPPLPKHPAKYRGPEPLYPVLYLLHGLGGHYDNWAAKTQIVKYAAEYKWTVIMPEGGDGWYTDSATVPNDRYESYLLRELFPLVEKWLLTGENRDSRAIAGLSMGGYGAVKFGLKHPELFSIVGSFSGAFDAPMRTAKSGNKWPSIPAVFGGEESGTRTENNIFDILRGMDDDRRSRLPYIYFACGTEDTFLTINREFDSLLLEKKVPHEFRELPGKHAWDFWDQQVEEFLRVVSRRSSTQGASRK